MGVVWLWEAFLLVGRAVFSCFAKGLVRGIQHWSLLIFEWCLILVLRWRPLGEFLRSNSPRGWEFSGGSKSWTHFSDLRGAANLFLQHQDFTGTQHRRQNFKINGETMLNSQEHAKRLIHLQRERKRGKKDKNRSLKIGEQSNQ